MLFTDIYKTIIGRSEFTFRDKGSKFIGIAIPVKDEEEVKQSLLNLKKEYYDATHHCYAYLLGFDKSAYRINDDGEPSGTAGRPIYGQILSNDLTNILIIVVRYYGGTKLGVPGLINAYKTSAKGAIENSKIIEKTINDFYKIGFNYILMNDVMRIIKDENLSIISQNYDENCSLVFSVRRNNSDKTYNRLSNLQNLNIKFLFTK